MERCSRVTVERKKVTHQYVWSYSHEIVHVRIYVFVYVCTHYPFICNLAQLPFISFLVIINGQWDCVLFIFFLEMGIVVPI